MEVRRHRVVRISTQNELGFCSICGKPALAVKINGKWVLRHVTKDEQHKRKEESRLVK